MSFGVWRPHARSGPYWPDAPPPAHLLRGHVPFPAHHSFVILPKSSYRTAIIRSFVPQSFCCRTPTQLDSHLASAPFPFLPHPGLCSCCAASSALIPSRSECFIRVHRQPLPCPELLQLAFMAGRGRCRRRRSWIQQRCQGSKLGGRGEGAGDILVKPNNHRYGEWICVRGHRIRLRGRMRVDADGDVYVPDSEDEEVDLGGISVAANGDHMDVAAEEGAADGVKVAADMGTGEEMHPEVAARLKKVLGHMDPTFSDVFVSM
nr:unnamed protein product [Digitaria exilis]